jgi:hypothetical protein
LIVALAYACLAWQQLRYGIEYDESANLTVIKNLAEGRGYATTGTSWGWYRTFDPGASTGPVLLLPGAAAWYLSGGVLWIVRIVPLLFFLVYLGSLGWLFTALAGRWAGLIAVASPLVLAVGLADISTVSLVPGRYVGEFAAVAFTVLMAALIYRRQPLLAGVAGGLAIQTKFNFALPILVVLLVGVLGSWLRHERGLRPQLLRLVVGLAIPSLLFEVFRFVSLGTSGYIASVKEYIVYLLSQSPAESDPVAETIGHRLAALLGTLSAGGALLILLATAILICGVFASSAPTDADTAGARLRALGGRAFDPVVGLLGAAGSILLWWAVSAGQASPRIGLPVLLLAAPVLSVAAFVVLSRLVVTSEGRTQTAVTAFATLVGMGAGLFILTQGWTAATSNFGERLYNDQVAAAAALKEAGTPSLPNTFIWHLAQLQILSGIPSETKPGVGKPTVLVFDSIRARNDFGIDDARAFEDECPTVLFASQGVLICSVSSSAP